jgi:glycosyltransferase involved in cell wall biosynthesis
MSNESRVIIIMPAYNTAHILETTYNDIPKAGIGEIILVDDGSTDSTATLAKKLGITVINHRQNRGYGAAQKTGYREAVKRGADIVVMVHSDHQYDPTLTPKFIEPITSGKADAVTGSRMLKGGALEGGMPLWKYIPNRFLTKLENLAFNTNLTDYHNGFRAYSRKVLESIPFEKLSDKFDFDTDIMLQIAIRKFKISEVAHHTRYRQENSQMSFSKGLRYGLKILLTIGKFKLHQWGIMRFEIFQTKNFRL